MSDDVLTVEKLTALWESMPKRLMPSDVTWEFRVSEYMPDNIAALVVDTHQVPIREPVAGWVFGPLPPKGPRYLVIARKPLSEHDQLLAIPLEGERV